MERIFCQDLVFEDEVLVALILWTGCRLLIYDNELCLIIFWHPTYYRYPVVGINWDQANAVIGEQICQKLTPYQIKYETNFIFQFKWEYAARGNKEHSIYPWEVLILTVQRMFLSKL